MQLYVNKDRSITKKIVQHAEKRGIKGLFITVDAPQLGRREKVVQSWKSVVSDFADDVLVQDMRMKFDDEGASVQKGDEVDRNQGAARAISVSALFSV